MNLAVNPPILPMLAKRVDELPAGGTWIFEPKWDGFRALIFRDGDEILIQSRDEKSLNRYFPELIEPLRRSCRARCVLDGEIVIATMAGSISSAAAPHSSRRVAGEASVRANSGIDRVLRPALRRRSGSAGRAVRRPAPRTGIAAVLRRAADPSDAGDLRIAAWPRIGFAASKARASTASWPSRRRAPTSRTSA